MSPQTSPPVRDLDSIRPGPRPAPGELGAAGGGWAGREAQAAYLNVRVDVPELQPPSGALTSAVLGAVTVLVLLVLVGGFAVLVFGDELERAVSRRVAERVASRVSLDVGAVVEKMRPSVVSIETRLSDDEDPTGAATGVIVSEDGLVLTNNHVVSAAPRVRVVLHDGSQRSATFVGAFPDRDIAMLRIPDAESLVPAELGESSRLEVGDDVVAIGNALGLGGTPSVTKGIVSALGRSIEAPGGLLLRDLIQTDTAINPGNSGGPLVDASGRVVGINTAILEGAENIGFAIAIDSVKPLIDDLRAGRGEVNADTAFLGVATVAVRDLTVARAEELGVRADRGVAIVEIVQDSAAEEAGLQEGDVILEFDGEDVDDPSALASAVAAHQVGDEVEVVVDRRGRRETLRVRLGSRAGESGD
ncbi:MAG: hypothetical protein KatS3mg008_1034 [Acidimicrobiales bacterium]|nr:MAG: hypothetical protein KatS3mg008_1034 [Acidimicrobiales bacterium]